MYVSLYCVILWIYCIAGTHQTTLGPKQDGNVSSLSPATVQSRQELQRSTDAYYYGGYSDTKDSTSATSPTLGIKQDGGLSSLSPATVQSRQKLQSSTDGYHYGDYSNDTNGSTMLPFPDGFCTMDKQFNFVVCSSDQYCCGKQIIQRKCCPKLPSGALFGIICSATVISIFTVCCLVACCKWCDICPYRRARLAKKVHKQPDIHNPNKTRGSEYTIEDETGQFCAEKKHNHTESEQTDFCDPATEKIISQPDQVQKNDHILTEIPLDNDTLL